MNYLFCQAQTQWRDNRNSMSVWQEQKGSGSCSYTRH